MFKPPKTYFNDTFGPLLAIGKQWEKRAQQMLIKYYDNKYYLINECNDNRFDFALSNRFKYEVKTDFKALQTNNIFIEYIQFGKASGIATTQANYYIIILPKKEPIYLLIDTLLIDCMIEDKQYLKIIYPNSKNYYTGGYLFKVETILLYATIINI